MSFWWVLVRSGEGRTEYMGPFDTKAEAEAEAFNIVLRRPELTGQFEIVEGDNSTAP